jgi:dTDP-4-amino-4,6-dideoxygalactose transaminase
LSAIEPFVPRPRRIKKSYQGPYPKSERAANEVLPLPMFPELTEGEQVVVNAIAKFYS